MAYKNKEDQLACQRRSYKRNADKRKKEVYQRKRGIAEWLRDYKTTLKCEHCGYNRHPAALTFHHRNPDEKESTIANAVQNGWSRDRILVEIQKCDVLCANCHAILHDMAASSKGQDVRLSILR